ncbi:MAG TPA: hypothetical protein VFR38_00710 [Gaiellaceae bacterium]|nr:hypothetical protein [Gaiellaceae bacterium]
MPVYGLAELLFEPVHDRLRQRPLALRGALYGAGILAVEYASGRLLHRLVGYVPWNYNRARFSIDGLVRIDYLPLWAAYGLGLERLHDLLVTPSAAKEKPELRTVLQLGLRGAPGFHPPEGARPSKAGTPAVCLCSLHSSAPTRRRGTGYSRGVRVHLVL